MKTFEAVEKVQKAILKDPFADAIFLKGSIGRGDDDEYSDVDMYVLVSLDNKAKFLNKRLDYLKSYKPLLYYSHENFVTEQIVAIFEDGLHFDLYTVTKDTKLPKDEIKVLYDKNNVFKDYSSSIEPVSDETLIKIFDNISYDYTEIYAAYKRNNMLWVLRLLSHAMGDLTILIRSLFDSQYAMLGFKKINKIIPENLYNKLLNASNNINSTNFKEAYLQIIDLQKYYLKHCNLHIGKSVNMKLFDYVSKNVTEKF